MLLKNSPSPIMNTKTVLVCLALLMCLAACAQQASIDSASHPLPEATIFTAKAVLTMDSDDSTASAVAVAAGKIVAVGDLQSIKASKLGYSFKVDDRFVNKVIMPGFIDNHLHPALAGILLPSKFITPFDWSLPGREIKGVQGQQEYLERLTQVHNSMSDPHEMLITWGYHQYFHGEISRVAIDAVSKERPIIVWQRSFHELYANSAALYMLGINAEDFTNHPAVSFERGLVG